MHEKQTSITYKHTPYFNVQENLEQQNAQVLYSVKIVSNPPPLFLTPQNEAEKDINSPGWQPQCCPNSNHRSQENNMVQQ